MTYSVAYNKFDADEKGITTYSNLFSRYARLQMAIILSLVDICSLLLAGYLALEVWAKINPELQPHLYINFRYFVFLFIGIYALRDLYPAIAISPAEELRRLSIYSTVVCLVLAALTFWIRPSMSYSRGTLIIFWIITLILVPFGRVLIRSFCIRCKFWGEPIAIIGFGEHGKWFFKYLENNPLLGFKPILAIEESNCDQKELKSKENYPEKTCSVLSRINTLSTAIIIVPEVSKSFLDSLLIGQIGGFKKLIMVSEINQVSNIWVTPRDLGGFLGLEVHQKLLNDRDYCIDWVEDFSLALLFGLILLPLLLLIAFLLMIKTKGNILYAHKRIGKGGKFFLLYKFCTMESNADQVLAQYFDKHPELKLEWQATHKIKSDPRVTPIGRFLRKYSLDELPQLWNVLKGEMSLVGPRPIVEDEVKHYRDRFNLYVGVLPGMTGLWQVSGRTDTSYTHRVQLDEYYIRNWSLWLDIYIIVRTIWVLLLRKGAY